MLLSHIGSHVKRRQSQSYEFKEFAKITNFGILKQTLHLTHLPKLLDKMCNYEMDPTSIVEDTERTRFCPQTDTRTDKVKPVYPPFNFVEAGGIMNEDLYVDTTCMNNHMYYSWYKRGWGKTDLKVWNIPCGLF